MTQPSDVPVATADEGGPTIAVAPDGTLYTTTQPGLYALRLEWVRSTWHAECDAAPAGTCSIASTSVPSPVPLYVTAVLPLGGYYVPVEVLSTCRTATTAWSRSP